MREPQTQQLAVEAAPISQKNLLRLKLLGLGLTLGGIALFAYFIYIQGIHDIAADIGRFGWLGFVTILGFYFGRITVRAMAWKLSIYEPYALSLRETISAVIIGEMLSDGGEAAPRVQVSVESVGKAPLHRRRLNLRICQCAPDGDGGIVPRRGSWWR